MVHGSSNPASSGLASGDSSSSSIIGIGETVELAIKFLGREVVKHQKKHYSNHPNSDAIMRDLDAKDDQLKIFGRSCLPDYIREELKGFDEMKAPVLLTRRLRKKRD